MRGASGIDGAPKALLARALYDNHPDCSDELAFCRGDILTILEQNVPESEGWWQCLLHGRQGLAPANRLHVLEEAPTDGPCAPLLRGLEETLTSSEDSYQAPSLLSPPPPGPVYEPMKSWVEGPPPATVQVYEFPDPAASARIVCEKMLSFPKQTVFSVPRPALAALPALYDVPVQRRGPPALKEPEKQQLLYDIPASPRKAGRGPPAGQPSRQSVPVASTAAVRRACYKTLPNPQKSEWIYDTPASPAKADVRKASPPRSGEELGPHALPQCMSSFHSHPNGRARSLAPDGRDNVPAQENQSLPNTPARRPPAARGPCPSDGGVGYQVPSSFLVPRVAQQNTTPNIYDTPKALRSAPRAGKEPGIADRPAERAADPRCAWLSRGAAWPSPEPDRLSVSSSDSRASVTSSCSSSSTDSSSSSSCEEPAKEHAWDLEVAKGTVRALQEQVASSVAGLMLFVSRRWRCRAALEANVDAVRRAAGHIEESLREFLEFARGVCAAACRLASSDLQARIRDQLQTIASSYHVLLESKESLDVCRWSLDVLATDQAQGSLDDLERFVLVARMVPEDAKRFASIVIANGRLLFQQNGGQEESASVASTPAEGTQLPRGEGGSPQRSSACTTQREAEPCPALLRINPARVCEKLPDLEENLKPILEQRLDENKDWDTPNPSSPGPQPSGQQDAEKKAHLSEHCRLYFGALFKAIGVFHGSLSHSQPPEILIAQSKLVIMIGQKLVDTLCKETQASDTRNEILCGSSHLCSLLKSLALATKQAVLRHPSPAALGQLRAEAQKLEQHARQFRGTLE